MSSLTGFEVPEASLISMVVVALVAGAVGSVHCVAMCGPLVLGCARGAGSGRAAVFAQQGGRLLAYSILGAIAGSAGRTVDGLTLSRFGWRALPIALGSLLVILGLATFFGFLRKSPTSRFLESARGIIRNAPASLRPLLLGSFSALLPCGMLHSIVIAAAGSGSAATGAAVLTAFFVGTAPPLIVLGLGARRLADRLGGRGGRWIEGIACLSAGAVLLIDALVRAGAETCCGSGG